MTWPYIYCFKTLYSPGCLGTPQLFVDRSDQFACCWPGSRRPQM